MPSSHQLSNFTEDFCNFISVVKLAYIRKLPNGKYRVFSEKGRNMGTYDSKEQAKKRLREIEYFKHAKAYVQSPPPDHITYSSTLRFLKDHSTPDVFKQFQTVFKKEFDRLLLQGNEQPEEDALEAALQTLGPFKKSAASGEQELGNPEAVGRYLSQLIHFVLRRLDTKKKPSAIKNLKKKIYFLNEYNMAAKKMPAQASLGTVLTIIKHLLFQKDSTYIRKTLNSIVKHL